MEIVPALLAEEWDEFVARLRQAESFAEYVQVDLMDGIFVPTKSFEPERLSNIVTDLRFEIHLMVNDPVGCLRKVHNESLAGVVFHLEAATDPLDAIQHIEERGLEAGIAFRPETALNGFLPVAEQAKNLLFLTVDPGRYGSPFKPEVLDKVAAARALFPGKTISVDGGVSLENLGEICRAGADRVAVGSRIFVRGEPAENYRLFVERANGIEAAK